MSLQDLRRQYMLGGLLEVDAVDDPIEQFRKWMDDAIANNEADWFEPTAMTLATSAASGEVTARIVLLKRFDDDGFVFFTNYESPKAKQLQQNANAAL
ncbi:MAG: pyridoxamine 5'-phosphate oxidase family protein, partial [Planctomycetales bacterium]|nr:pyridoxamine 5'-phosphate oxidase family protein [Planctomycetales bacterium]